MKEKLKKNWIEKARACQEVNADEKTDLLLHCSTSEKEKVGQTVLVLHNGL